MHSLNLKQVLLYCLTGMLLGLIYIALVNGFSHSYPFINGVIIGILLGAMIGVFEIYLFGQRLQRYPFFVMLSIRVCTYITCITVIILIVVTTTRSVRHEQIFLAALQSEESLAYIFHGNFKTAITYTFLAAVLANFIRLVSFKIGRGMPTNFFLGLYYQPKLVERIFIFLNISNADHVLKKNNLETYHQFIHEIYCAISVAAIHHNAYVYEYVDDQMIVYWKANHKARSSSWLFFCKEISTVMRNRQDYTEKTYGIVPKLRCVLHGGNVIQAEIGELKTEIVFHGDVLNTAARMMSVAHEKKQEFVASQYIVDRLTPPDEKIHHPIGEIELRGKQIPVSLYSMLP